jgi:hypothetical protein
MGNMDDSEQTIDETPEADVAAPAQSEVSQDKVPEQEPWHGSKHFRELRQILKEQQSRIRELESLALSNQRSQEPTVPEDDLEHLNPDDIPTWKQVRKAIDREAEKKARELMAQQHADSAEDRMRAKHRDYDEVVSEDNVRQLVDDDPVLADTIRNSPDPYKACYALIKKSAFFQKSAPLKDSIESKRIEQNSKKPISSNAIKAERPLTAAHSWASMQDSDKMALYKEMQEAASRRG